MYIASQNLQRRKKKARRLEDNRIVLQKSYFYYMKDFREYISVNKEILGGQPVFTGTRVPIETLFNHLERGVSLDEFLLDFPTVSRHQATGLLEIAEKILTSDTLDKIYEITS